MINSEPSASSERTFNPLTVKIMIVRIGQARQYLMKRWFLLLCAGITFALVCTAYFYFKSATYSAEISFALDEPSSEVTSAGFADLPEGLGLRQSPDPGGTVFSTLNNVTELIRSRLLIEKTLKSTVTVGDHQVVMADFFLDSLDYRTSWISDRKYLHLKFDKDTADESTNRMINALLGRMYDLLTAKIITVEKKGRGTSILGVKCTSTHELFSKYFIETLISNTEFYYTETRTQRAKINLVFIQGRTDSVRKVYNSALYGRASFTDANVNPARQVAIVPAEKQQTDITILRAAYMELTRALEGAKATLTRETPLFQYLDTPSLPLKKNAPPLTIYFFVFFIAGVILSSGWLLFKQWLRLINEAESDSK